VPSIRLWTRSWGGAGVGRALEILSLLESSAWVADALHHIVPVGSKLRDEDMAMRISFRIAGAGAIYSVRPSPFIAETALPDARYGFDDP
jgi:hypothetical protein